MPPAVGEALDQVVAGRRAEPILLLGTWNLASPWLVEWRAWQSEGRRLAGAALPLFPDDLVHGKDGAALAARLAAGPALVLELAPLAADAGWRAVWSAGDGVAGAGQGSPGRPHPLRRRPAPRFQRRRLPPERLAPPLRHSLGLAED